jgi:hypothetical protein
MLSLREDCRWSNKCAAANCPPAVRPTILDFMNRDLALHDRPRWAVAELGR